MLFDLIFLPRGVSEHTAKADDIARATVEAPDALGARWTEEATRMGKLGHYIADVQPSGTLSPLVLRVRDRARRELDASDRPPGYESGQTAAQRRGLP
jgi:hypothetical protein